MTIFSNLYRNLKLVTSSYDSNYLYEMLSVSNIHAPLPLCTVPALDCLIKPRTFGFRTIECFVFEDHLCLSSMPFVTHHQSHPQHHHYCQHYNIKTSLQQRALQLSKTSIIWNFKMNFNDTMNSNRII